MRFCTCVFRIYVNSEKQPHCPLPDGWAILCQEARTLECRHCKMLLKGVRRLSTDSPYFFMVQPREKWSEKTT